SGVTVGQRNASPGSLCTAFGPPRRANRWIALETICPTSSPPVSVLAGLIAGSGATAADRRDRDLVQVGCICARVRSESDGVGARLELDLYGVGPDGAKAPRRREIAESTEVHAPLRRRPTAAASGGRSRIRAWNVGKS